MSKEKEDSWLAKIGVCGLCKAYILHFHVLREIFGDVAHFFLDLVGELYFVFQLNVLVDSFLEQVRDQLSTDVQPLDGIVDGLIIKEGNQIRCGVGTFDDKLKLLIHICVGAQHIFSDHVF